LKLEVIAVTLEDALAAEAGGANRIEVIAAPEEGGLTPSSGLVEDMLRSVSIDVQVTIRPHSRSFAYGESEFEQMAADIERIRRLDRPGIVVGCLTPRLLPAFLEAADVREVHFGTGVRSVYAGKSAVDSKKVQAVRDVLDSYKIR
jgi:copper homeostasis protein